MKKLFVYSGLLVLLLVAIVSCGRNDPDAVRPAVLTHVYTEQALSLPEEYTYNRFVSYADGVFTLTGYRNVLVNEQYVGHFSRWLVYTDGREPTLVWEKPMDDLPAYTYSTESAEYELWADWSGQDPSYTLVRTDTDGNTVTAEAVETHFGDRVSSLSGLHVDDDGYVYLFTHTGILILQPDLSLHGVISGLQTDSWAALGNRIVVYYARGMENVLAEVLRDTLEMGQSLPLPQNRIMYIHMDDTGTLYYIAGDGLYRYETDENGTASGTLILDFVNSNLTDVNQHDVAFLGDGRFFMSYYDSMAERDIPAVMTAAPDVDLSEITVLELVSSDVNAFNDIQNAVVRFNKAHTDVRLYWTDYSKYDGDTYGAGEEKLAMDLEAGLIRPDIYYGSPMQDSFRILLDHGNYRDLLPLMEDETVYNPDNLFGCVKNTYTIDGKLFALPEYIELTNRVVTPVYFDDADMGTRTGTRTGWSVEEMLDIAENLPEGASMTTRISRQTGMVRLLGQNWQGLFIDFEKGTCDFDSEDFIRLLRYLETLPETEAVGRAAAEAANENMYIRFQEGRLVMGQESGGLEGYVQSAIYGEDRLMIGYPARDGLSGTALAANTMSFIITKTCPEPETAWEFVKQCAANEMLDMEYGLPIWKSEYDRETAAMLESENRAGRYYFLFYDGSTARSGKPFELEPDGTYKGEPGIQVQLTREDAEQYKAWLDTVGRPITRTAIPEEITDIVSEEMSKFYGGAATPESCAEAIQSRVKLWLNEHS